VAAKSVDALTAERAGSPAIGEEWRTGGAAGLEETLAGVLAGVMHTEQVPAGRHFFDELGADSLVMAHFCARVRKRGDLPPVSMKDIYAHPTISSLAVALADAAPVAARPPRPAPAEAAAPASTGRYVMCGVLQFLCFLGYAWIVALVGAWAYGWISDGSGFAPGGTDCTQAGKVCANATCLPKVCEPGGYFCSGGNVNLCGPTGATSSLAATCSTYQFCKEGVSTCQTDVCVAGNPTCNGNMTATWTKAHSISPRR